MIFELREKGTSTETIYVCDNCYRCFWNGPSSIKGSFNRVLPLDFNFQGEAEWFQLPNIKPYQYRCDQCYSKFIS